MLSAMSLSTVSSFQLIINIRMNMKSDDVAEPLQSAEQDKSQIFFPMIEKVGSFGRYQYITIIFWCTANFICGQFTYSMPFLFHQDPYDCTGYEIQETCEDFVCGMPEADRWKFIPNDHTIWSLANQFGDFRCPQQILTISSFMTYAYFGGVVGYFLLTVGGEMMSRKRLMTSNMALFVIGVAMTLIFYEYEVVAILGLFVGLLGIVNCYLMTFMYLIQTVEKSKSEVFSVFVQVCYGIGVTASIPFYYFIGNWWYIFLFCQLVPGLALLIGIQFLVVDTPQSLIIRNKPQVAYKKMMFIGKMNSKTTDLTINDITAAKQRYQQLIKTTTVKKTSVFDIFKYKSTRTLTLLLIGLQCGLGFIFYAPGLMIGSFNFDIFISGLGVAIPQLLSTFISQYVIGKYRRRMINFTCFGCGLVTSIILLFLWDQNDDSLDVDHLGVPIIVLTLIFINQLAISVQFTVFFIYLNEVYPTQARVIGMSTVSFFGAITTTANPLLLGVCFQENFPIMIIFAASAILCIVVSYHLPQTFGEIPKDVVEQFSASKVNSDLLYTTDV